MLNFENYKQIIHIAHQAGEIILDVKRYAKLDIDYKSDNSPVTLADNRSNSHIIGKLQNAYPNIPIVSEEAYEQTHQSQNSFFLIDPLDGTRDFIEGTDDYCINIALIYNNAPVLGVIYVPATQACYYAMHHQGSFKINNITEINQPQKLSVRPKSDILTQTISKRSSKLSYQKLSSSMACQDTLYMGSAKKFCAIAEGDADIYPRLGHTGEWDTAAGEVLVTEAGGYVRDKSNQPIIYGKQGYINDAFYAANFLLDNS